MRESVNTILLKAHERRTAGRGDSGERLSFLQNGSCESSVWFFKDAASVSPSPAVLRPREREKVAKPDEGRWGKTFPAGDLSCLGSSERSLRSESPSGPNERERVSPRRVEGEQNLCASQNWPRNKFCFLAAFCVSFTPFHGLTVSVERIF
jgi:hypothetical protein